MAITLGKDTSVSVGGTLYSARNLSISYSAKLVEIEAIDSFAVGSIATGYDASMSCEINDPAEAGGSINAIVAGNSISCGGGAAGMGFTGVITSVTESAAVDGVATVVIEAKQTRT